MGQKISFFYLPKPNNTFWNDMVMPNTSFLSTPGALVSFRNLSGRSSDITSRLSNRRFPMALLFLKPAIILSPCAGGLDGNDVFPSTTVKYNMNEQRPSFIGNSKSGKLCCAYFNIAHISSVSLHQQVVYKCRSPPPKQTAWFTTTYLVVFSVNNIQCPVESISSGFKQTV